ncbi:MAG: hypothetical protein H6546_07075 [Chitinophagales bacterium]|nr:hypothetical protein [Chitinophagales bacterium]
MITLDPGEYDPSWDAGLVPLDSIGVLSSLGDYVWFDSNANGVQDSGETGVNGIVVELYWDADNSGTIDTTLGSELLATTVTGDNPDTLEVESGWYVFENLSARDYIVSFVPGAGYILTGTDLGGDDSLDSDADGSNPLTNVSYGDTGVISLGAGVHDPNWDAGLVLEDPNNPGTPNPNQ